MITFRRPFLRDPKEYPCERCGHTAAKHARTICFEPGCRCQLSQKRVWWKAKRWARKPDPAIAAAAEQQKAMLKDLAAIAKDLS